MFCDARWLEVTPPPPRGTTPSPLTGPLLVGRGPRTTVSDVPWGVRAASVLSLERACPTSRPPGGSRAGQRSGGKSICECVAPRWRAPSVLLGGVVGTGPGGVGGPPFWGWWVPPLGRDPPPPLNRGAHSHISRCDTLQPFAPAHRSTTYGRVSFANEPGRVQYPAGGGATAPPPPLSNIMLGRDG